MSLVIEAGTCRKSGSEAGTKAIDVTYLRRFTMGNLALEQEVLTLFIEQAPAYIGELRTARSLKAWADAAHTLKGSARAVGAWRVARMAECAERIGAAPEPGRRQTVIAAIAVAVDEAARFVNTHYPHD